MNKTIAEIRKDYSQKELLEENLPLHPIEQFGIWWDEAMEAKIEEANAMTLATASADGVPSARIVLLKGFGQQGFVFYTNYTSAKGKQLTENPKASLVFFWKELERQVRITGMVEKTGVKESEEYFLSRPQGSQLAAWTSPQSQVIESRLWLDDQFQKITKQMEATSMQRPPNWGGYIVKPAIVEFWQGRPNRLHDRIQYSRGEQGEWRIERLAP